MLTLRGLLTPAAGTTLLAALGLMAAIGGGAAAAQLNAAAASATASSPAAAPPPAAPLVPPVRVAVARTDGFDPATCVPQPAAASEAAAGRTSAGEVQVTLVLPATTVIAVDDLGQPVRVSTNTGQAPCITDQFIRIGPDGLGTAADPALTKTVLSAQFGDDWAPGVQQVFPVA